MIQRWRRVLNRLPNCAAVPLKFSGPTLRAHSRQEGALRVRTFDLLIPRQWRGWLALIAAAVPPLFGVGLSCWYARQDIESDAYAQAARVIADVERMLVNASQTAQRIGVRAGEPCESLALDLRKQVDSVLFVRSVEVFSNDRDIYCSSVYGADRRSVDLGAYVDGSVRLVPHSGTLPDSTLLAYRWVKNGGGAVVTVDGRYIREVLASSSRDVDELLLDVGGVVLGAHGLMPDHAPLGKRVFSERSTRFPVTALVVPARNALLQRIERDYLGPVFASGLLGVLLGLFVKRGLEGAGLHRRAIARAMRSGEFVPYFQPLVDAADGRWVGAEVLIRWQHPRKGVVGPDSFIPLAESCDLIKPMTRDLFRSVSLALAEVKLPDGFRLSFNVSAQHMRCKSIVDDCVSLQRDIRQPHVHVVLELTERELLPSEADTRKIFDALHRIGIKIALDDFGTGHSSLSYLHDLEIDALKIDRSFVAKIGAHTASEPVLDSILELATKLRLTTVAEGVETCSQAQYLRERGVPILQGFLFGRPMPAKAFIRKMVASDVQSLDVAHRLRPISRPEE